MQLESTLTCPSCGHQSVETMPTDAASSSMTARAAGRSLSPSLAIVACSVPMARSRAHRSRAVPLLPGAAEVWGADLSPRPCCFSASATGHASRWRLRFLIDRRRRFVVYPGASHRTKRRNSSPRTRSMPFFHVRGLCTRSAKSLKKNLGLNAGLTANRHDLRDRCR